MCSGRRATYTEGLGAAKMSGVCSFLGLLSQMDQEHLGNVISEQENIAWVCVTDWHWPIPRRGSAACWDCGPESRRGHGCRPLVSVVFCQIEVCALGWSLVQRGPSECAVFGCDCEASILRRPWPTGGCCVVVKKLTGRSRDIKCILFHCTLCKDVVPWRYLLKLRFGLLELT